MSPRPPASRRRRSRSRSTTRTGSHRRPATRILAIADALGYRPDPVARMLTQRRTGTIGHRHAAGRSRRSSRTRSSGCSAPGVAAVAEERGYGLHFISPLHGSLSRAIDRATVDGVVAIGLTADHPEIAEIRRAGLPMVTVDSDPFDDLPSVDVDDEGGARAAAAHLAALGHRDVADHRDRAGRARPEAARTDTVAPAAARLPGGAWPSAGVEVADEDVLVSPATYAGGVAAIAQRLGGRPPSDGDPRDERRDRDRGDPGAARPGPLGPGRRERRRVRRHRAGRDDGPAADHRPPTHPRQGRGGRAPAAVPASPGARSRVGHRRLATRLVVRASTRRCRNSKGGDRSRPTALARRGPPGRGVARTTAPDPPSSGRPTAGPPATDQHLEENSEA